MPKYHKSKGMPRRSSNRRINEIGKSLKQSQKAKLHTRNPYPKRSLNLKRENAIKNDLKEHQVGITEFINRNSGFNGVIKARFSDFHVNEIDLEGNEVKLTNLEPPIHIVEKTTEKVEDSKLELGDLISTEIWDKVDKMMNEDTTDKAFVDIDVTGLDKHQRTLIHNCLNKPYKNIVTTTLNVDNKKYIKCFKSKGTSDEKRSNWKWSGPFVYFIVHKENADTAQVASDLARNLGLPGSCVNYAGTKDKRAKTSQWFCVRKREPSRIVGVAKKFHYFKVGNFKFMPIVLKLGNLIGNRFRIALRHIDKDNDHIEKSLQSLKMNGFINYYGLQRFGNCASIPTYEIGKALLKGNYKEACELILKPRDGDLYELKEARNHWWKTRNAVEASEMISNDKFIEKKLLHGLATYGANDYANSLRKIPRNVLLLYTHAYQSLVWNKIASRRIKKFGIKLIPGDLVFKDSATTEPLPLESLDVDDTVIEELEQKDTDEDQSTEAKEEFSDYKAMVKSLTEEDISSGKYTIFDVVLPLPGYDITYPRNEVEKWYEEILSECDLSSEKLKSNVKTYALAGAYRKLIIRPAKLQWEFKRYDADTSILITSDYEELKGVKADEDIPNGKRKALILDFILPTSAYATMALREILKRDTSPSSQTRLNADILKTTDDSLIVEENNDKVDIEYGIKDEDLDSEMEINKGEESNKDENSDGSVESDEICTVDKRKQDDLEGVNKKVKTS